MTDPTKPASLSPAGAGEVAKLVMRLQQAEAWASKNGEATGNRYPVFELREAATALTALQRENERLTAELTADREKIATWKWAAENYSRQIVGLVESLDAAEARVNALSSVVEAARLYVKCSSDPSLSPYIRENGRFGKSPWAEFKEALAALPPDGSGVSTPPVGKSDGA